MSLTRCRECQGQVSDQARSCPHCGVSRPVTKASGPPLNWSLLGRLFLIFGLVVMVVLLIVFKEDPNPTLTRLRNEEKQAKERDLSEGSAAIYPGMGILHVKQIIGPSDDVKYMGALRDGPDVVHKDEVYRRKGRTLHVLYNHQEVVINKLLE